MVTDHAMEHRGKSHMTKVNGASVRQGDSAKLANTHETTIPRGGWCKNYGRAVAQTTKSHKVRDPQIQKRPQ